MIAVTQNVEPINPDSADTVFWTAIILSTGAIALIFGQFIANMYSADPAGDLFAGLLGTGYFLLTLSAIAYYANTYFDV
jgi:hypothetical protein